MGAGMAFARAALLAAFLASGQAQQTPAELSDGSRCKSLLGHAHLGAYQRALSLSAAEGGEPADVPLFLPVYSSLALDGSVNSRVSTAVVFLHGMSADANSYFCEGLAATRRLGVEDTTLVLAPWFGNQSVGSSEWLQQPHGEEATSVFWSRAHWMTGGDNAPDDQGAPARFTTSFDALDALLRLLGNGRLFPGLRLLTIAGFSAGAQLALHYAFASSAPSPDSRGPHIRVLVSDPGSYLYFDARRPAPACRPSLDTGTSWFCNEFIEPSAHEGCPSYDNYKYGLQMPHLHHNLYMQRLTSEPGRLRQAVADFPRKDVRYILGARDTCNCKVEGYNNGPHCACPPGSHCAPSVQAEGCCDTSPDSTMNLLDVHCAAMLQGTSRLQRGLLYASHLRHRFTGHTPAVGFFLGRHNSSAMYASDIFHSWAFKLEASLGVTAI